MFAGGPDKPSRPHALLPGRRNGAGPDPYLDISRLTADTGFTPAFDTAAAVAEYVRWRREISR